MSSAVANVETAATALVESKRTVAEDAAKMTQAIAKAVLLVTDATTAEQAQWATDRGREAKAIRMKATQERDIVAKPIRKIANDHAARWNPTIKLAEKIEQHTKGIALRFQAAERERQAAALQAASTQTTTEVAAAVAVLAPPPVGLSERESWSWEEVDRSKVPAEYFLLDTKRLDREARTQKEAFAVPGFKPVRVKTGVYR